MKSQPKEVEVFEILILVLKAVGILTTAAIYFNIGWALGNYAYRLDIHNLRFPDGKTACGSGRCRTWHAQFMMGYGWKPHDKIRDDVPIYPEWAVKTFWSLLWPLGLTAMAFIHISIGTALLVIFCYARIARLLIRIFRLVFCGGLAKLLGVG